MIKKSSKFIQIHDNNSDKTIVVFSSANVPVGKFSGANALRDEAFNYIFVNCPNNTWFLAPIEDIGDNVSEIAYFLREEVLQLSKLENTLFYGGSMGGYGALLFGCLLEPKIVVATGIETDLTSPESFFQKMCNDKESVSQVPKCFSHELPSKTKFMLLFGELSLGDYWRAKEVYTNPNVELVSIENGGHRIPPYIDKNIGLLKFLQSAFDYKISSLLPIGKLSDNFELLNLLSEALNTVPPSEYIESLSNIEKTIEDKILFSYVLYAKGVCYSNLGKRDLAYDSFLKCVTLNKNHFQACEKLSNISKQNGDINYSYQLLLHVINFLDNTGFDSVEYFYLLLLEMELEIFEKIKTPKLTWLDARVPANGPMRERFNKLIDNIS